MRRLESPIFVQVRELLDGLEFPASKEEVVEHADLNGADENLLQVLDEMPDVRFESLGEVVEAIEAAGVDVDS